MYLQPFAQSLVPGEPTPDAHFREEYYAAAREEQPHPEETLVEPAQRHFAAMIRNQVLAGVGRFFV